jgi:DNA-binding beta-propeller fold protein YncE
MKKCVLLALLLGAFLMAAAPEGGYKIVKKFPVPGDGGWDYVTVDPQNRKLYVSHGTEVNVLDADTGEVVGKIPDTKGVHGVAIAPEAGRGFTTNGGADTSTMFDLKTLKVLGEIKTGKKPDAVLYDPATKRVFTFNGDGESATAIDAATGEVAGTVELGGGPEAGAADGKGIIFVNLEEKAEVVKFDSQKLTVLAHWPLAPCKTPTGMALDRKNGRLFVGCRSKVMAVVDVSNGKVITTVPIGTGVDGTVFDRSSANIFNSNGDGTVTVIHQDSPDKYSVVENVQTQPGAKTIALDPKTHQLYLSVAESKQEPAAAAGGRPRRVITPGTFTVLVLGK